MRNFTKAMQTVFADEVKFFFYFTPTIGAVMEPSAFLESDTHTRGNNYNLNGGSCQAFSTSVPSTSPRCRYAFNGGSIRVPQYRLACQLGSCMTIKTFCVHEYNYVVSTGLIYLHFKNIYIFVLMDVDDKRTQCLRKKMVVNFILSEKSDIESYSI